MKRSLASGFGDPRRKVAGGGRDWCGGGARDAMQMYTIYGTDAWRAVGLRCFHAAAFAAAAVGLLLYFDPVVASAHAALSLPLPALRLAAGLSGSLAALSALCLLSAAASLLRSSLLLRWEMALRMLAAVPDWSAVRSALDVGCGRGVLLNALALRLKRHGAASARVVGLHRRRDVAVAALRRAAAEGVGEYVTCREGDARALPFPDAHFDVVVSADHLGALARGPADRGRALAEMIRVLRPGGVGVVWDLASVPEMAQRLRDMRMDHVRISDRVTAFTPATHILSFRKPTTPFPTAADHEWRANIC